MGATAITGFGLPARRLPLTRPVRRAIPSVSGVRYQVSGVRCQVSVATGRTEGFSVSLSYVGDLSVP